MPLRKTETTYQERCSRKKRNIKELNLINANTTGLDLL